MEKIMFELTREQVNFIKNNLALCQKECREDIAKYGYNDEATAGADDAIDMASSIISKLDEGAHIEKVKELLKKVTRNELIEIFDESSCGLGEVTDDYLDSHDTAYPSISCLISDAINEITEEEDLCRGYTIWDGDKLYTTYLQIGGDKFHHPLHLEIETTVCQTYEQLADVVSELCEKYSNGKSAFDNVKINLKGIYSLNACAGEVVTDQEKIIRAQAYLSSEESIKALISLALNQ